MQALETCMLNDLDLIWSVFEVKVERREGKKQKAK